MELCFDDRKAWHNWLVKNHEKEKEVWLIYYKKNSGKKSISYVEAVEEALCFGWIDSQVRTIDNERYKQKYTPRSSRSVWSKINKEIALRMIKENKMSKAGLKKIEEAKQAGTWQKAYTSKIKLAIPKDLKIALQQNPSALVNFKNFAATYHNMYVGWVTGSKRQETRTKRIREVVNNSLKNKKTSYL